MKGEAQPLLSADGRQVLDKYTCVLQHIEDLFPITLQNYLSERCQLIAWCECSWHDVQEGRSFTPLLIRYRDYLQTILGLKPATMNRTLMSLKRYFAWSRTMQFIQYDPASPIKFVPKEALPPRHLSDNEEDALVAAVNATGTLRNQTMIVLLLYRGPHAQELCALTRQQIHLSKHNRTLYIIGKRRKVREAPLNATARSKLNEYFETLSPECQYLFLSEKTQRPLTKRAFGHLVTKYAYQARMTDVSPHDLRHRFGYRTAEVVPLHRLAQIIGHDLLDTTLLYIRETKQYLQQDVKKIAGLSRRSLSEGTSDWVKQHSGWHLKITISSH